MATRMTLAELREARDLDLGASSWIPVDQQRIQRFAEATEDLQWIHTDLERAATGPFGRTIAHGYLSLSLMPRMLSELLTVTDADISVNYGINKLRFPAPVPSGSEVHLHARILSSKERKGGLLLRLAAEVEIRGEERPALVAELLYLVLPA